MLLEADTLIYDNNDDTVTASAASGSTMAATGWSPSRSTTTATAGWSPAAMSRSSTGRHQIYSDKIDITDDFGDGFVNALRVETVDKTYFAAESAERRGGILTTFNNGVYTACEPCEDKPDKAPIWRIKATKIIWNSKEDGPFREIERSSSSAYRSPTCRRSRSPTRRSSARPASCFPASTTRANSASASPFPTYFALSPTYDLTVTGTGYTEQGFLGEAEWRQRFNNGQYSVKIAGIHQATRMHSTANTVDSGPPGDPNKIPRHDGHQGRVRHQPALGLRLGYPAADRQGFLQHLRHRRYRDYVHRVRGLPDRTQRPQLFRPARHALQRAGG